MDMMRGRRSYLEDILHIPVGTNMRTSPPTVSLLDPVSFIINIMIEENIGAVIAVDEGQPVGIITERDVFERIIRPQKEFETTPVRDVMSKPLIIIEAKRSVAEALKLMHEHNVRRLVVTKDGVLIGLITERRLLEVAHSRYLMRGYDVARSIPPDYIDRLKVAYVSTYPPRECGIATYTYELVDAISRLYVLRPPIIAAINAKGGHYDYSNIVKFQIDREVAESFVRAAEYINESDINIVNLQHEFGLFGGFWGKHILSFLEELEKPVVTTLHTVLLEPDSDVSRIIETILQYSKHVIVMARAGVYILENIYSTLSDKVRYIPHGCPNVPFIDSEMIKGRLGLEERIVLSTFGLLSQGKGIEYAIQALPPIVKDEPRILYLIIGETHPEVRKHEGEMYRKYLYELVNSLGLEENIRFVNRFLPKNELIKYLQATDIYLIPYPNKEQISSGTLLYALSTGKAIISTPFLHAEEVISEECALECEFRNPDSITDCIRGLLQSDVTLRKFEERAYEYSRGMIWPNVAMKYVNLFYESLGK
jgi:CBS domain-containing protein/glycosyltransferase involved in cell wall biosynthesis